MARLTRKQEHALITISASTIATALVLIASVTIVTPVTISGPLTLWTTVGLLVAPVALLPVHRDIIDQARKASR